MPGPGDEFRQHFSSAFNQDLTNLRSRVIAMGAVVEQHIADAVMALQSRNENMARSVIGGDLHVNALEIYLDDECRRILARRHPAAGDLRLVFAVIKTVTDIERIGDQAKSIARQAIKMAQVTPEQPVPQVQHLGSLVGEMVHNALGAFAGMDANQALTVERADITADAEYQSVMRELTTRMTRDARAIPWALQPRPRRARAGARRRSRKEHCRVRDLHGARQRCPARQRRGSRTPGAGSRGAHCCLGVTGSEHDERCRRRLPQDLTRFALPVR